MKSTRSWRSAGTASSVTPMTVTSTYRHDVRVNGPCDYSGRLFTGLKLRVNESKSAVDLATRRKILGYSFWVAPGHVVKRRVSRKALQAMKDRVRLITKRTRGRSVVAVAAELRSYLVGWKEYYRLADTPRIFSDLDEWIRHRLRALHLKQWKRGTTIYRELRARGMSAHPLRRWPPMVDVGGKTPPSSSTLRFRHATSTSSESRGWLHQVPLSEPPGADPHAGWCGRGRRGLPDAPMPIRQLLSDFTAPVRFEISGSTQRRLVSARGASSSLP